MDSFIGSQLFHKIKEAVREYEYGIGSDCKDRLKALLGADRMQCTPDITEKLSADLYHILSKYMEISREHFNIQITRSDIHIKYTGENN